MESIASLREKGLRRNVFFSFLQTLINTIAVFAVFRYLVISEGAEVVGLWSLTFGIVAFAQLMNLSGASGLARLVAIAGDGNTRSTAAQFVDSTTMFILVLFGVLLLAAYFPAAWWIGLIIEPEMEMLAHRLLPWALLAMYFSVLSSSQLQALDGLHRADERAVIQTGGTVFFAVLALALVAPLGIIGLAVARVAQHGVVLLASRLAVVRHIDALRLLPSTWSTAALRESIHYGARLQLTSIGHITFHSLTRILIGQYAGLAALGVFEIAYRLVDTAFMLIMSASTPLIPSFATLHEHDRPLALEQLRRVTRYTLFASGLLFPLICLAGPILSAVLMNQVLALFLAYVALTAIGRFLSSIALPLYFYARSAGMLRWNIISSWSMVLVVMILIPLMSFAGVGELVGAGALIAMIIGDLITVLANARMLKFPLRRIFDTRLLVGSFSLTIVSAVFLATYAITI